ncbi:MAG: YhfC family intramembrane metalloprotease [Anaerolineaceae bacterium]|nr:YhfC family intramembrane metalloprotease [Anaerolineaceae bacterium]
MDSSLVFHLANAVLMIAIPLSLAIILMRRWKLGWRILIAGAATFILSQVGHIPFNALMTQLLGKTALVNLSVQSALIFNAIFLGLSAGFFEEFFRYGMFRWWLKDAHTWRKGILAGVGHGGVEAIILGGLALFSMIQLFAARNMDLSTVYSGDTLRLATEQVRTYWSATWYDSMLGAVERLFAIVVQISLAVIIVQCFIRKQKRWLWLAIGYHALIDAVAVYAMSKLNPYWVEGIVGVFALISLGIIFILRSSEPLEDASPVVDMPLVTLPQMEPTSEQLDNSKYS